MDKGSFSNLGNLFYSTGFEETLQSFHLEGAYMHLQEN